MWFFGPTGPPHTTIQGICRSCDTGRLFDLEYFLIYLFTTMNSWVLPQCGRLPSKKNIGSQQTRGQPKVITLWTIFLRPKNVRSVPVIQAVSPVKSGHSVNMSHLWICWWRLCDRLHWQRFSITPRVTKHLDQSPLAKHCYWELGSRINNKWMMRLRTRLGARASLWFPLHLLIQCDGMLCWQVWFRFLRKIV